MFGAFNTFGKLGAIGKAIAAAWSPLSLWPDGIDSPGMWISPRTLTSQWQDSTGTTPVATPGTVADSANPVGWALDIRAGATVLTDPGNHMTQSTSVDRPLLSARVNLLTYSQEFTFGAYVLTSCTMEADSLIAPDGTLTADSYLTNAGNGRITNAAALPAGSIVSGVQYTMSVYCKNISGSGQFFIYCGNSPGLSSPTLTATTSWQRFTWTFTANSTGNDIRIVQVPAAGDLIAVWGAQVNIGPTAARYQRVTDANTYDYSGFPLYWKFDGADDALATGNIDLSATDKVTVVAGVMKTDDTARMVAELSSDNNTNAGSFFLLEGTNGGYTGYQSISRGDAPANTNQIAIASTYSGVDLAVITTTHDIAGDLSRIRRNGVYKTDGTADKGTGNFGNYPLYIGARGGTSTPFGGNIYALLIFPRILSAAEIVTAERYVAQLSGVTL